MNNEQSKARPAYREFSRNQWIKEMEQMTGRTTFADLTPAQQELLYWIEREMEAKHLHNAAVLTKSIPYTFGYTAETYDFAPLNERIIKAEDEWHEAEKRVRTILERYNTDSYIVAFKAMK